jgi:signal transduction histidine kinase
MASPSFRWRLIAGSALWTVGLVGLVNQVMLFAVVRRSGPHFHAVALCALALGCMVLGIVQVERGMASLKRLRSRLALVRQGQNARITGKYPSEVQPLVDELNALLEHRDRAVSRAQARAGDLAHGLKTPLAILSQEAGRAKGSELADSVERQVDRMRRQIDYHLAQARAAASGAGSGARCGVAASVEPLIRTVSALYAERHLAFSVLVDARHEVRVEREDLDEMLGNLLDNACKWAASRVTVRSTLSSSTIDISVEDDGPGIESAMREAVLRRGVRADEAAPGSGLGLAIVRDLAELHEGRIALDAAPGGGLSARLTLPCITG